MKTTTAIAKGLVLGAAFIAIAILTGRVTSTTTTTAPDGTVTVTKTTGPDALSVSLASAAAAQVIAEK